MRRIFTRPCSRLAYVRENFCILPFLHKLIDGLTADRDCARWKLTTAEVQKRRALFWELFITDCWQVKFSIFISQLQLLSLFFRALQLVDSPHFRFPSSTANYLQILTRRSQKMVLFSLAVSTHAPATCPSVSLTLHKLVPYWKARFGAECVSAVVQGTLTSRAPRYSIILDLDRKVRDMELPQYAQGPTPQGLGLAQTMSHFMPHNYRELSMFSTPRIGLPMLTFFFSP